MGYINDSLRQTLQFDRPEMICQFEWGYWRETLHRWRSEGMPPGEPWDAAGITFYDRVPVHTRIFPAFETAILSQTSDTQIVRGADGVISEVPRNGATRLPRYIRHPVENVRDFELIKERLDPHDPRRFPADWLQQVRKTHQRNHVLVMGGTEISFFGWARDLVGVENLLLAFYDQPELIHAINRHQLYFIKELYSKILRDGVQFDFIFCWEDMSYKNGPLISPALVREFMLPYYRELVGFFREINGRRHKFLLDSDGDVLQLIPLFREVGIDGILPFEVAAGMDIVKIAGQFPDLIIAGGIDKREIAKGPAAIDRELEAKLPAIFRRGGYLPSMDHHVPPEVGYADFRYYIARVQELYAKHGRGQ